MNIDTTQFAKIEKMDVFDARKSGMEIITKSRSTAAKKARLNRDIQRAPSTNEVVRILWMCALAGEGLGSMDSSWNKTK